MIDTHAHLDACHEPVGELLARARRAGVTRIVTIGTGLESCRRAIAIAQANEGVYAAVGIDPHRAKTAEAEGMDALTVLARERKVVAIGETGLDGHYGRDTMPEQHALFRAHLDVATATGLPVVIHCREAAPQTEALLRTFGGVVVLHCFSEPGLLAPAIEHGWYLSFAGNVTYPRAESLREAAAAAPAERLLVETDSPYLSPQPLRGRSNEPAHVIHTAALIAELRGVDPTLLAAQIDANASAAFGLP